jgi:hypothetical protein
VLVDESVQLITQGMFTLPHAHGNGKLESLGRKALSIPDRGHG